MSWVFFFKDRVADKNSNPKYTNLQKENKNKTYVVSFFPKDLQVLTERLLYLQIIRHAQ